MVQHAVLCDFAVLHCHLMTCPKGSVLPVGAEISMGQETHHSVCLWVMLMQALQAATQSWITPTVQLTQCSSLQTLRCWLCPAHKRVAMSSSKPLVVHLYFVKFLSMVRCFNPLHLACIVIPEVRSNSSLHGVLAAIMLPLSQHGWDNSTNVHNVQATPLTAVALQQSPQAMMSLT